MWTFEGLLILLHQRDMQIAFRTTIKTEGSTKGARITIPFRVARSLTTPGWLDLQINGEQFYGYGRRPASRPSTVNVTLPTWRFPTLKIGDEIDVWAGDAVVTLRHAKNRFDWLRYIDLAHYFPTERDGVLHVHSRYESPFELARFPDEATLYWLLGIYQAEGSKSTTAVDWTIAVSNAGLMLAVVETLVQVSIPRGRQYVELLYNPEFESEALVHDAFAGLELRVASVRPMLINKSVNGRIPKTMRQAKLHVQSSKSFLRMTKAALAEIFTNGFPSRLAAERFAIGWLDGDGTITETTSNYELRLAGLEDEHRVVQAALQQAFGWGQKGTGYIDNKQGTHMSLRASEILNLLDAGAFKFSMNRARLLVGFEKRTERLREIQRIGACGYDGMATFVRWGLLTANGQLTVLGQTICDGFQQYEAELGYAKELLARSPKGKKGLPYT
jgi:hypothetical protein